MAKLMILYGQPEDSAAFEDYYTGRHIPYVSKHMPNVRGAEHMRVLHGLGAGPSPYYRVSTLSYDSVADLLTAIGSADGQSSVADLANFASGGATVLIIDDDGNATP